MVDRAAGVHLAFRQLGLDFLEHAVGHHHAQSIDVRLVPGSLQGHKVAFGCIEEAFGVETGRNTPVLRAGQGRTNHRTGGLVACIGWHGVAAFPRTGRRVVADVLGTVRLGLQNGCAARTGTLKRKRSRVLHPVLSLGRLATHEPSHRHHDAQCQQAEHQDIAHCATQAQRAGQPSQTQTSGQTTQHRTPRLLGCHSGRGSRRWFGSVLCGSARSRRRSLALRHVIGLLADRFAATQPLGSVGVKADHDQCHCENKSPKFHSVSSVLDR